MLTTALQSKTPLPQDSLSTRFVPSGIVQHDILVLTQRLINEPGGFRTVLLDFNLPSGHLYSHFPRSHAVWIFRRKGDHTLLCFSPIISLHASGRTVATSCEYH